MNFNTHPILGRLKPLFYSKCFEVGIIVTEICGVRNFQEQINLVKSGTSKTFNSEHLPYIIPGSFEREMWKHRNDIDGNKFLANFSVVCRAIELGKIEYIGSRAFDCVPMLPVNKETRKYYMNHFRFSGNTTFLEIKFEDIPTASPELSEIALPLFDKMSDIWQSLTPSAQNLAKDFGYKYPEDVKCQQGLTNRIHYAIKLGRNV